jgi:DNA-directed RNA polymerase
MQKFCPKDYLKIDIGNHWGLDKELFETRIKWVDDHEADLEKLESQADDKYRYVAAVMAYREVQAGKPTGHLVGFDACSSGPAIMSALMRDEIGARNTGLIGNERADIYTKTTDTMNKLLKTNTRYERKTIKDALMP